MLRESEEDADDVAESDDEDEVVEHALKLSRSLRNAKKLIEDAEEEETWGCHGCGM